MDEVRVKSQPVLVTKHGKLRPDGIIGATAIVEGLPLVTADAQNLVAASFSGRSELGADAGF